MTMNNPLATLQAFSPTAQGITNQVQAGSNVLTQGLQKDLLRQTIQGNEQAALAQQQALQSQSNIQNTAGNLVRLNTAIAQGADENQLAALLQQNIARAQAQGGNGADSQEALQVLQTGGLEALRNLAGQTTAVFEQQGILTPPELETVDTAEGIGFFNPVTGRITVAEGAPITTAQWKAQKDDEFRRIADETKAIDDKNTQSDKLRGEVNKLAKELQFVDTFTAFNRIAASNDGTPAGDLALIFNYMKMLDPGSTVREGEFATAQNAEGVSGRIINVYNNLLSGERLNEGQRENFTGQASKIFDKAKEGFESTVQPILNIGKSRGLTRTDILGDGFFESFTVVDDPVIQDEQVGQPVPAPEAAPVQQTPRQTFFDSNGNPQEFELSPDGTQWVPVGG